MKRALVTGGSGDIGAAISKRLAKGDVHVFVHANKNLEKAEHVVSVIRQMGGCAETLTFDVTCGPQCEDVLTKLCEDGAIDVIVNNAGIATDSPMAGMTYEDWYRVIDVSLNGFFNVTKPLLMPLISSRRGGRIINITSAIGIMGNRGQTNYAAAKGALHSATKSLALELASRKITVNAIAPGLIDGGMALGKFDAETVSKIIPMRRAGTVDEVAALVSFIASDEAGYITGQIISVNGGIA
ncbi:MAG TPA: 3-oxoacyl-ACP reductase FabG [Myxococcota bacterium]|nr:3-oxoacyl-ACP reductase FabG [Myxococcota bacterium]